MVNEGDQCGLFQQLGSILGQNLFEAERSNQARLEGQGYMISDINSLSRSQRHCVSVDVSVVINGLVWPGEPGVG